MSESDLIAAAIRLEQAIASAGSAARLALQPEFSRTIRKLQSSGVQVPGRFRRLEAALAEEVAEERFDNMPV
jgi:hypothetical protein